MNGYGRGEDKTKKEKVSSMVTRETFGMTFLLFGIVLFAIATVGSLMLGEIGVAITAYLLGFLGFFAYPFLILVVYASVCMVAGKNFVPARWIARSLAVLVCVFLIVHLSTSSRFLGNGFGSYMGGSWKAASESALDATGGGVLFGLLVYPAQAVLSRVGAYVVFSVLLALSVFFFLWATPLRDAVRRKGPEAKAQRPEREKKPLRAARKEAAQTDFRSPVSDDGRAFEAGGYEGYAPESYGEYADGYGRTPRGRGAEQTVRDSSYPQPFSQTDGYGRPSERGAVYHSPYSGEIDRYTPPSPENTQPVDGRDLIFSSDPAENFRKNLIYREDSYYNTRLRKQNEQASAPASTYSDRYASPDDRSPMPRKVVEQKPEERESGFTLRDLNYPRRPSYRAADDPSLFQSPAAVEPLRPERTEARRPAQTELERTDFSTPSRSASEETREGIERYRAPQPENEPHGELRVDSDRRRDDLDETRRDRSERGGLFGGEPAGRETIDLGRRDESLDLGRRDESLDLGRRNENLDLGRRDESLDLGRRDESLDLGRRDENLDLGRRDENLDLGRRDENLDLGRREENLDLGRRDENLDLGRRDESLDLGRRDESLDLGRRDESLDLGRRDESLDLGRRDESLDLGRRDESLDLGRRDENLDLGRRDESLDLGRRETDENDLFGREDSRAIEGLRSDADLFDDDEPDFEPPARGGKKESSRELPPEPAPKPQKHVYKPYCPPSLDLLRQYPDTVSVSKEEIDRTSSIILDTLAGFRVDAEVMRVISGPSVTRFDIDVPPNVKLSSVTKHAAELAMRLHARDGVNVYSNNEAGYIAVEVPNSERSIVGLRSIMQSEEFRKDKPGALTFAIGKDVEGRCICGNISKMKHVLVAGATGSGKSVCLNAMLVSLISKYSPEELRLILIDPKKVEFAVYDKIPHLMINEIVADAQKAVMALNWAIKEMERRYELFGEKTRAGIVVRELDEYNANLGPDEQLLPKIVIVIDELADLMSVSKKDIEERIQRITQKARAAGIHLVIATQRPSVDVITGVIKGNLPTRIAFRVIQEVDSRTILDDKGAEKLLGNGDLLYRTEGMFACVRVQGAFLSSAEVQAVVEEIKANNESYFDPDVADYINRTESGDADDEEKDSGGDEGMDPLYLKALAVVVQVGQASISLIQRKFSLGYNHAGKIIEWMELMGYISRFDGKSKARTVLLTKEEYESKYGPLK